jgi:aspartate kinase
VQKYGGSSVSDVGRIRRVAERVVATRELGTQVVVVVSAMGKTTDELLALARQIAPAPPRRELDMLLTCGERISMALLSMAINELGYEAISFTGSQCGILTNDRHSGARIIEVRPVRVQDELERGRVVIVAGYQGVSYKREITTLGRGGSDTTAVALAAALGAEHREICSDVDGVYSADPNVVDSARLLDAISHDEMEELAAHGACVLHPAAVEFARTSGIALYARATARAAGGTRVGGSPAADVCGVTGQRDLVRLRLRGADALAALGGVPMQFMRGSADDAVAYLALDDVPDWRALREQLDAADVVEERGAVSVVGGGLDVAKVVAAANRPIDEIATSPLRVTLYCAAGDVDALIEALHRALVE